MSRSLLFASLLVAAPLLFAGNDRLDLDVVVGGESVRELWHHGSTYVEASRGEAYSLRLSNPTPHRVAVALAVDGLNTIDAKHGDAWSAAKWVLEPYETTEIHGWQVSDRAARRFVFSGERGSYGAALGKTANLGVIEAVFFRERRPRVATQTDRQAPHRREAASSAPAPEATHSEGALDDDYAATAMGGRTRHDVTLVHVELEREPLATVRLRYEFRPALVKLGVLPGAERPLDRREHARGFSTYCPEP